MVLVGQDGVQRPAIHFPAGGHLLAFLTCLETALVPTHGRLDPPLWSQTGKGKVFPKIKRKGYAPSVDTENGNSAAAAAAHDAGDASSSSSSSDYVFRIVTSSQSMLDNSSNVSVSFFYNRPLALALNLNLYLSLQLISGYESSGRNPARCGFVFVRTGRQCRYQSAVAALVGAATAALNRFDDQLHLFVQESQRQFERGGRSEQHSDGGCDGDDDDDDDNQRRRQPSTNGQYATP